MEALYEEFVNSLRKINESDDPVQFQQRTEQLWNNEWKFKPEVEIRQFIKSNDSLNNIATRFNNMCVLSPSGGAISQKKTNPKDGRR